MYVKSLKKQVYASFFENFIHKSIKVIIWTKRKKRIIEKLFDKFSLSPETTAALYKEREDRNLKKRHPCKA